MTNALTQVDETVSALVWREGTRPRSLRWLREDMARRGFARKVGGRYVTTLEMVERYKDDLIGCVKNLQSEPPLNLPVASKTASRIGAPEATSPSKKRTARLPISESTLALEKLQTLRKEKRSVRA